MGSPDKQQRERDRKRQARQGEIRTQRRADTQVDNYRANHRETEEQDDADQ